MKVFSSDLDGVLADASGPIEERVRERFNLGDSPYTGDGFYVHEKFGLDKKEVSEFLFSEECFDDPAVWFAAEPMQENIEEMARWCMTGMVPSIVTARPPHMRIVTEMWLAKYGVPYSNLLFGAGKNKGQLCWHIDASFMIEDRYEEAFIIAQRNIKCYVLETPWNKDGKEDWATLVETNEVDPTMLIWVKSFKDIAKIEKI